MTSLLSGARPLRCLQNACKVTQWLLPIRTKQCPAVAISRRFMATQASEFDGVIEKARRPMIDGGSYAALAEAEVRLAPVSPSYFSRYPIFNDRFAHASQLLSRYENLPTVTVDKLPRPYWKRIATYRVDSGESVKASYYAAAMHVLKRLYLIHPSVVPREVTEALMPFRRQVQPPANNLDKVQLDRFGRSIGVGRRKRSVARAWVVEGNGEMQVNGKTLAEAFGRIHDRESALWPLRATGRMDKYNVWALVEGGGTTGQAEALTLAVAKALLVHEPDLKPSLRRAGCVTRDPREVERKKPGLLKARKRPAWNKR